MKVSHNHAMMELFFVINTQTALMNPRVDFVAAVKKDILEMEEIVWTLVYYVYGILVCIYCTHPISSTNCK